MEQDIEGGGDTTKGHGRRPCRRILRDTWHEWAYVCRSLVEPDEPDIGRHLWRKCVNMLLTGCNAVGIFAATLLGMIALTALVCALVGVLLALATLQGVAMIALTPDCMAHADATQCALDRVYAIRTTCHREQGRTISDEQLLRQECGHTSLLVVGVIVCALDIVLGALLLVLIAACLCSWDKCKRLSQHVREHRTRWRSLAD